MGEEDSSPNIPIYDRWWIPIFDKKTYQQAGGEEEVITIKDELIDKFKKKCSWASKLFNNGCPWICISSLFVKKINSK